MRTSEFDFNISTNVLPNDPIELRGKSRDSGRMIVLDRSASTIEHTTFPTICDHFRPGDLLVLNDSYVMSNSLKCRVDDQEVDVILCGHESDGTSIINIIPKNVPVKPGSVLRSIDNKLLSCSLIESIPFKLWRVQFAPSELLTPTLEQYGTRKFYNQENWKGRPDAYRSVYSKAPGSLEIPSAGLHFSHELLSQAAEKGVEFTYITLHVGATEIVAVRHISEQEIENHKVKSEYFEVSEMAAKQISQAMAEGRRVIAIGTTVMRTLESLTRDSTSEIGVKPQAGWTDLYIYPGFEFKVVNVLLTNLHRPRSSHIVLTAAFGGKDLVMRSYDEINQKKCYEFDMFGDSMLIV